MNRPDVKEFQIKRNRIDNFLDSSGYDALVIGTTANFAWATCGGDSHILLDSQAGSCLLVFTRSGTYCVANRMDARRLEEQELCGLGFSVVSLKWFETPVADYALGLVKDMRVLSDIPLPGVECNFQMFYRLHYPLTEQEIMRYRQIGKAAEEATAAVAAYARAGLTGSDIAAALMAEFANRQLVLSCMILGVDDDISRYRHPLPWDKKIDEALMLVLSGKRYGLNVPITRMIYFKEVPEDIQKRYLAACTIEANTIKRCVPGEKFFNISMMQKSLYKEFGYEKEWEEHFVGGLTGYMANDASFCTDRDAVLVDRQTFNWYVTITGVNVEETMASMDGKQELFTVTGLWPTETFVVDNDKLALPQIMIKE